MNRLFSIIIPVYNTEKYLDQCIESLCSQTFKDFEVIFVNDGSTDKSGEICENFKKKHFNIDIKVIHQKNSGQIVARQAGIDISEGDYCLFLDSDDSFVNDALEKISKSINKYHADMIIYNAYRISKDFKIPFWPHYSEKELYISGKDLDKFRYDIIATSRFNSIWSKAIKRNILQECNRYNHIEYIRCGEDYLMQLPMFDIATSYVYIPEYLYLYNYNTESITVSKFDNYIIETGMFICAEKLKYALKWNIQNSQELCDQYLLNQFSDAVKQLYKVKNTMPFSDKKRYLIALQENTTFRKIYKNYKGRYFSNIGRIALFFLYHRLWFISLLIVTHDPKIHGNNICETRTTI